MNAATFVLLTITVAFAVVDWMAVHLRNKALEYLAKPLTMVMLIAAVGEMDPTNNTARSFFTVALVFCLMGDIFLMLPNRERWFVFGLGSFLIGHLAYVPGLFLLAFEPRAFLIGLVLVAIAIATVGRKVVSGVRAREPKLAVPVTVYMSVISVMVAMAVATGRVLPVVGAVLFYGSDTLIAWNGFLKELRWAPVGIMVSYHVAQVLLALSLI